MASSDNFSIKIDDPSKGAISALLAQHLEDMESISPPESRHALNVDGLREDDITFWAVWDQSTLAGCGALKALSASHGEVKSMRTSDMYLRQGVARLLLRFIVNEAGLRGYDRLSLETGSMAFFIPAIKLYREEGFVECDPFASYVEDPNSVFMMKLLQE